MFKNEHPQSPEVRSRYEGYGAISLQRTYWYDKAITGMGVTSTRHGITPASVVLELMNGQVATLDLRMLDPRRPGGDPKMTEKVSWTRTSYFLRRSSDPTPPPHPPPPPLHPLRWRV